MSDDSFSISEFAEYINGEDGDGQQLVEYLRKKKGVTRPHRIFPEVLSDSDSISFNVQLEKIITPPNNVSPATVQNQAKTNTNVTSNDNENPTSPVAAPRSPSRRSPLRKSGGYLQSDHLRRVSLRRLSSLSYGRRMLLKEFESTLKESEFVPPVYSTPMTKNDVGNVREEQILQLNQDNEANILNSSKSNASCTIPSVLNTSNSHNLMCCLHKQNDKLEKMLDADKNRNSICNINTNNNECSQCSNAVSPKGRSLIRRTYTIEKGDNPGEIILSPSQKKGNGSLLKNQSLKTISHKSSNKSKECVEPTKVSSKNSKNITTTKESEMVPLETKNLTIDTKDMACNVQNADNLVEPTTKSPTQEKENRLTNNYAILTERKGSPNVNKNNLKITNVQKISVDFAKNITDDESESSDENSTNLAPLNLVSTKSKKANKSKKSLLPKICTAYDLKVPRANTVTRRGNHGRPLTLNKAPSNPINGEKFAVEIKKHLERLTNYEILDLRTRNSLGQIFPSNAYKTTRQREALEKQHQLEEQIQYEIKKRSLQTSKIDPKTSSVIQTGESSLGVHDELFPVPHDFRDDVNIQQDISLLQSNVDFNLVTFVAPEKVVGSKKTRKRKKIDEEVQSYLDISNKLKMKNKSYTKRMLYSKNNSIDENLNNNSINEKRSSAYPAIHVVSPQGDKLRNNKNSLTVSTSPPSPPPSPPLSPPPSPPPSTSTSPPSSTSPLPPPSLPVIEEQTNLELLPTTSSAKTPAGSVSSIPDDEIFKRPLLPAPKKGRSNKKKPVNNSKTHSNSPLKRNNTLLKDKETDDPQALRRSKRGHVPLKNSWSFNSKDPTPPLVIMLRQQLLKSEIKKKERQQTVKKSSSYSISSDVNVPIASSTANSYINQNRVHKKSSHKKTSKKSQQELKSMLGDTNVTNSKNKSNDFGICLSPVYEPSNEQLEEYNGNTTNTSIQNPNQVESLTNKNSDNKSHKKSKQRSKKITSKPVISKYKDAERSCLQFDPAPVDEINNLFDQLKEQNDKERMSVIESVDQSGVHEGTKKCRVRLQRMKLPNSKHAQSQVNLNVEQNDTSSTSTENSKKVHNNFAQPNEELLSWLKGITNVQNSNINDKMFKEMRCSAAGNLVFTDLEGIDYAFYDTEEKACLGYLRFKPHQIKPPKRAKKYHLHFIVLSGKFNIGTNEDQGVFSTGDMIAINKGSRYKIENITDDIGILIVIKK